MPLCRISDTILYFAHIPKTGGSSIEEYIAAKGQIALRYNNIGKGRWSKTTPQHMPRQVFEDYVPQEFYDQGFAVLRDPVAKMMSTYKMRISTDHTWWNPVNWLTWGWGRARGRDVYAIPVWRFRLSLDVDTWIWWVTRVMRRRPYIYDGHCLPQAAYVAPGHRLFLFEDGIDPVFRWIDEVTGTPAVPGSFHQKKAGALPVRCTAATEARLRAVYAEDYALIARLRAAADRPVNDAPNAGVRAGGAGAAQAEPAA